MTELHSDGSDDERMSAVRVRFSGITFRQAKWIWTMELLSLERAYDKSLNCLQRLVVVQVINRSRSVEVSQY